MAYLLEPEPQFKTGEEHAQDLVRERSAPAASAVESTPPLAPATEEPRRTEPQGLSYLSYVPDQENVARYGALFGPVTEGLKRGQSELEAARQAFSQAAGPSRTYESAGAEDILRAAVEAPGGAGPEAFEEAKKLAGAQYAGPKDLEGALPGTDVEALRGSSQDLLARSGALGTLGGIGTLLQERFPTLTSGQLLFEARAVRESPEYRASALGLGQDVGRLFADVIRSEREAAETATTRTAEEEDIRRRSREYLGGRQEDLLAEIEARVAEEERLQEEAQEAVSRFMESGRFSDLEKIPEGVLGEKQRQAILGEMAPQREAKKLWGEIMRGYEDLDGVPIMTLGQDPKGRERWEFPKATQWWRDVGSKLSKPELTALRQRAQARQEALIAAGFGPATGERPRGKFAQYQPAFFRRQPEYLRGVVKAGAVGTFIPEDLRHYLREWDPGVRPSVQNVSTKKQRTIHNNINRVLDLAEDFDLQPAEEKLRRARLTFHVGRWLADERKALKARGEKLSKIEEAWKKKVDLLIEREKDIEAALASAMPPDKKANFIRSLENEGYPVEDQISMIPQALSVEELARVAKEIK